MKLYQLITNFENFGLPPNIIAANRFANRYSLFIFLFCLIGPFIISVEALINIPHCEATKHSKHTLCGFSTVVSYPYDISEGFLYYFHLLLQYYCLTVSYVGGGSFAQISAAKLELIDVRFDHLIELLKGIFKNDGNDRDKLRHCINYHRFIIR